MLFTDPTLPTRIVGVEIDGRKMHADAASIDVGREQLTYVTVHLLATSVAFQPVPAVSGPAGPASLDATCEEAVASSEHQTP